MRQPRSFAFTAAFVIIALVGAAFAVARWGPAGLRPPRTSATASASVRDADPATSVPPTAPTAVPTTTDPPPTSSTPTTTAPPADAGTDGSDDSWDYPPSAEELADWNRDADGLAAYLTANGVAFTRTVDADGLVDIAWDENDAHANDTVDEYWWLQHPLTATEIHDENDETMALDAVLADEGIDHTLTTDPHGLIDLEYDEDDDVANAIVDEFYAERE